jgi:hypothetical protein
MITNRDRVAPRFLLDIRIPPSDVKLNSGRKRRLTPARIAQQSIDREIRCLFWRKENERKVSIFVNSVKLTACLLSAQFKPFPYDCLRLFCM